MERTVFGKVARIVEFPFKAAGGVDRRTTTQMYLDGMGLDRLFAFGHGKADENGVYTIATQRDHLGGKIQAFANLSQIRPYYVDDGVVLTWQGKDEIFAPLDYDPADRLAPVKSKTFQGSVFIASRQDPNLDKWVSEHVGAPLIVVKAGQAFERFVDQDFGRYPNRLRFQDGYTFSPHTRASVRKVNEVARLLSADPNLTIHEDSFRGNIIWEEAEPGQLAAQPDSEHLIFRAQMGEVIFDQPKPCGRCPVTSVNQETGEVRSFKTEVALNHYKRWLNPVRNSVSVLFAENGIPLNEGEIAIGQEVVILEYRYPALVIGGKEIKPL